VFLFADKHVKIRRLEGKVKELDEALKTTHNQAKEVIERASEELAQAKLIKHGANQDLMQALKSVKDLKTQLETVQGERNTL